MPLCSVYFSWKLQSILCIGMFFWSFAKMFIEACFFPPNKPALPESDVTRRSEGGHRRSDPSSAVVNEAEILFLLALENTSCYTTCVGGWKKLLFLPPASFIIFSSCSSGWILGWRISHIIPVDRNLIRHEWTISCSFSKHILCCSPFLTEMQETEAEAPSLQMINRIECPDVWSGSSSCAWAQW